MTLIRIENSRLSGHVLPPVAGYEGKVLLPGGNNVELAYLEALRENMNAPAYALKPSGAREVEPGTTNPVVLFERGSAENAVDALFPTQEQLEEARKLGRRATPWMRFLLNTPHITIMTPEVSRAEVKKPQGPAAPADLRDRAPEVAIAFIELEEDRAVLNSWLKGEQRGGGRPDVASALKDRLRELGPAPKK